MHYVMHLWSSHRRVLRRTSKARFSLFVSAMSIKKATLMENGVKNGTSRSMLERCASVNEYFDVAFKVWVIFYCLVYCWCHDLYRYVWKMCPALVGTCGARVRLLLGNHFSRMQRHAHSRATVWIHFKWLQTCRFACEFNSSSRSNGTI